MKNLLNWLLALITLSMVVSSCSKNEVIKNNELPSIEEAVEIQIENREVSFSFNGVVEKITVIEDQQIDESLLSESFRNVYLNGASLEIEETNTIFLFNNELELDNYLASNFRSSENAANRGSCSQKFYRDHGYKGGYISGSYYSNLSTIGFNDKISSLKIFNNTPYYYVAKLYEHKYFGGGVRTYLASPYTTKSRYDLKWDSFGDKTSSIKVYRL